MSDSTAAPVVRARLGARPGDAANGDALAQLVLLDHHMVPAADDVERWLDEARRRGFRAIRTSALFPDAHGAFLDAGFVAVDRLVLLERDLTAGGLPRIRRGATRPMRARHLAGAAAVDVAAFGDRWGNDAATLAEVGRATPRHRARVVGGAPVTAFAISGRAGSTGYLQRLAVAPTAQRRGLGRALLHDALGWMARHGVRHALVNTAVDNERALRLYESEGFHVRPDELAVLERSLV